MAVPGNMFADSACCRRRRVVTQPGGGEAVKSGVAAKISPPSFTSCGCRRPFVYGGGVAVDGRTCRQQRIFV